MDFADRQYNLFFPHDGFILFIIFVLCVFSIWNQLNFFSLAFDIWLNFIAQSQSNDQHNYHYYYYYYGICVYEKGMRKYSKLYWINAEFKLQSKFCNQDEVDCWLLWFSIRMRQPKIEMFSEGWMLMFVKSFVRIIFFFFILLTNKYTLILQKFTWKINLHFI